MPDDKIITATQALYWAAFRQDKGHDAITAEAEQKRDQHFLNDRLVRHYLRHKAKGTPWRPTFYSRKEWKEIKKLTKADKIPRMLAAYKAKVKTTWQGLFEQSLKAAACDRACNRAARALLVAARRGEIIFYGIRRSRDGKVLDTTRAAIPRAILMADDWALKSQANELTHTPKSPRMAAASWIDLRLEQEQVKKALPIPTKLNRKKKSPASLADMAKFLQKLAEQNGGYLPSRDEYGKAVAEHFEGLGKVASDNAIKTAVAAIKENPKQYGDIVRSRGRPRRC